LTRSDKLLFEDIGAPLVAVIFLGEIKTVLLVKLFYCVKPKPTALIPQCENQYTVPEFNH